MPLTDLRAWVLRNSPYDGDYMFGVTVAPIARAIEAMQVTIPYVAKAICDSTLLQVMRVLNRDV